MPTSLPLRHDTRSREKAAGRLVGIFVIASVVGFVFWCAADHVAHRSPSVSYAHLSDPELRP
jgi:hypothetical protein